MAVDMDMKDIKEWISVVANVATAVGWVFAIQQIRAANRQFKQQKNSNEAQVFKLISDEWGKIYKERCALLKKDFPVQDYQHFYQKYREDYESFLSSEEWKQYRGLCAFFEMMGVLLYRHDISEAELFVLVSVDVFHRVNGHEKQQIPEGVIFSKLKGPIEYLRRHYREDIYYFYDKYLLEKYKSRKLPVLPLTTTRQGWWQSLLARRAALRYSRAP